MATNFSITALSFILARYVKQWPLLWNIAETWFHCWTHSLLTSDGQKITTVFCTGSWIMQGRHYFGLQWISRIMQDAALLCLQDLHISSLVTYHDMYWFPKSVPHIGLLDNELCKNEFVCSKWIQRPLRHAKYLVLHYSKHLNCCIIMVI
jgi:hypothetical protein